MATADASTTVVAVWPTPDSTTTSILLTVPSPAFGTSSIVALPEGGILASVQTADTSTCSYCFWDHPLQGGAPDATVPGTCSQNLAVLADNSVLSCSGQEPCQWWASVSDLRRGLPHSANLTLPSGSELPPTSSVLALPSGGVAMCGWLPGEVGFVLVWPNQTAIASSAVPILKLLMTGYCYTLALLQDGGIAAGGVTFNGAAYVNLWSSAEALATAHETGTMYQVPGLGSPGVVFSLASLHSNLLACGAWSPQSATGAVVILPMHAPFTTQAPATPLPEGGSALPWILFGVSTSALVVLSIFFLLIHSGWCKSARQVDTHSELAARLRA